MTEKKTVQDKYGFVVEVPAGPVEAQEESFSRGLSKMWSTVLKPNPSLWGELDRMTAEDVLKHRMLKSLIRECGIPEPLRKKFWPIISGANDLKTGSRVVYADIVSTLRQYKNESSDQIEKDLNRSFPGHPYFDSPQGMKSLRNVLTAFSWLNPAVGYTQSMNFWAGLMLLFVLSEETVFWLVVTVVERILPQQYYDNSMLDIIVDNQVMFSLLESYLPRVHQHISLHTTDLSPILTQWFLCLFVNTLPTELTLRILDVFLYEGNKVLFRAALGIFKCYEPEILKTESFEDLFVLIAKPVKIQDVSGFMTLIFDRIWLRAFGRDKISILREGIKKATIRVEQEKDQLRQLREAARKIRATQEAQAQGLISTSPPEPSFTSLASKAQPLPPTSPATAAQASSSTSEPPLPTPSHSTDPRRKTIRASMLPDEVKTLIDRKSWRAYKRSDEWHMIEEYFSVLDNEIEPVVISAPNSDQRIPLSVSQPDGVPKASKAKDFKPTTVAGPITTPSAIRKDILAHSVSPASPSSAKQGTELHQRNTAQPSATQTNHAVAGQPKRRSYAEVAKGPESAPSSSKATPSSTQTVKPAPKVRWDEQTPKSTNFASATTSGAIASSSNQSPSTVKSTYGGPSLPATATVGAGAKKTTSSGTSRSGFNTLGKTVSNFMSSLRSGGSSASQKPTTTEPVSPKSTASTTAASPKKHSFHSLGPSAVKSPHSMAKTTSQMQVLPSGPSVPSTSSTVRPKLTHAVSTSSTTTPVPKFTAAISQNPRLTTTDSSES